MIISKENRKTIYASLFKEGVMVAPKNFTVQHPELEIPNLEVVKALQSLTSRGYVHTQFSWQWYFYTLTDEGVEYLREFLHLPAEIVPATHKRPARPARAPAGGRDGAYRAPRGDRDGGDRSEYRRRDGAAAGDKKDAAPSGEYRPRFAGVGRGAPRQ
ncbi:40S ribosomal protein eS10 [Mycosarcoma maydis]|uniref:Ribosomal 40S subunit protein S10 n=1 Tax=Mycosarcoma maydis TaxID=5270 RepID=A0A0D1E104_MYCMD|nr:ribosomal 40S subunit protein S10 [Ustilago maydis 521]KIS69541.1 ribosomal 40S subunit protein S10 [Ustilago maydis 521]|eukprot:XP_011388453.1 ribosomal 40S subunit protein S10 [Ustilago maydis 521]